MKSLVKRENYINIQGWMLTELNLKGNEILIYAIIYGFSQDESSSFRGSLQYLADWTNSTKQGVLKCLQNLLEKNFIIKKEEFRNNIKLVEYSCTKVNTIKQSLTPMQQSLTGGIKQSLTNTIELDNITDIQDCIADAGNFSKNEEEVLEIPSASSKNISASSNNSTSSEIPNNPVIKKNLTTESYTYPLSITEEEYKAEWKKTNDKAEPKIGFKKSLENFLKYCTVKVQQEHGGWKNYLAEKWIPNEQFPKWEDEPNKKRSEKKPKVSEPYEYNKPPAFITLTTDLRNEPENFQALNEKFHEALKKEVGNDAYNKTWFGNIAILGFNLRTAILLTPTGGHRYHFYLHYQNRLTKITRKVCKEHFRKDGFKLNDYQLVLEEELTKTTTNI